MEVERNHTYDSERQNKQDAQYRWVKSPNYSSRKDSEVSAILLYHTGALALDPTLRWMTSQEAKISCHVLVPRNREEGIVQLVDFKMKAWHAGRALLWNQGDVNLFSVALQLVGTKDSGYTDYQYEATAQVCADIMNLYPKVTLNRILGHDCIAEKPHGPGPLLRWDVFFDELVRRLYGLEQIQRV